MVFVFILARLVSSEIEALKADKLVRSLEPETLLVSLILQ